MTPQGSNEGFLGHTWEQVILMIQFKIYKFHVYAPKISNAWGLW